MHVAYFCATGDGDVVVSVRGDLLGAASHFGSDLITATMTDVDKEEECSVATVLVCERLPTSPHR